MLNSGEKNCASRDKKTNILTLVLSEKKFQNEAKNHNPPPQVKWSVPNDGWISLTKINALHMMTIRKYPEE